MTHSFHSTAVRQMLHSLGCIDLLLAGRPYTLIADRPSTHLEWSKVHAYIVREGRFLSGCAGSWICHRLFRMIGHCLVILAPSDLVAMHHLSLPCHA